MDQHDLKLLLCKIRHRFVAWESTIRPIEVDTGFGRFTSGIFCGFYWQEMCSRCFKTRWTAARKKPKRLGAGDLALSEGYRAHHMRKIDKLYTHQARGK